MNVQEVMDELGDALAGIPGLNIFRWWADRITAPAAIVEFPETLEFDDTFGRGADRLVVPVVVAVSKADARSASEELAAYANGSGPRSVKATTETHSYAACDSVRVQSAEFGTLTMAGTEYLACTFQFDVYGEGTA